MSVEVGKGKEMDSARDPQTMELAMGHIDVGPVRLMSEAYATDNQFALL